MPCYIDFMAIIVKVNLPEKMNLKNGAVKNRWTIVVWDEDYKIEITAWEE